MSDIAKRFIENPLLRPADVMPSETGLQVTCLLNPGVFEFGNRICLVVRVAERPAQNDVHISLPVLTESGKTDILSFALDDPDLVASDARVIKYKGKSYLTTLSHLRIFESEDGVHFRESPEIKRLFGEGKHEYFGIEDCRVTLCEKTFYLTYTAVSENGVGVGLRTTADWKIFDRHGMILPPHNKDCAIFPEKINGLFYALHRPSSADIGGNYIWLAESLDGLHWGNHKCILRTRPQEWDSARVGAGASPIRTEKGWLEIYHGADHDHRYCLGAVLLDAEDPSKVLARTEAPIMEPQEEYETTGFFGHVVFTNGHIVRGDMITIYYGAADEYVCGARFSIKEIFNALGI